MRILHPLSEAVTGYIIGLLVLAALPVTPVYIEYLVEARGFEPPTIALSHPAIKNRPKGRFAIFSGDFFKACV
jgi:hypothetical protein